MTSKTQVELVLAKLTKDGFISRNWCLKRYISRLGAIIYILKKDGHRITANYDVSSKGKDYVYFLVK